MYIPTRNQIEKLFTQQQWPAISIYLPIDRSGDKRDPLRFKNLLTQVRKQLEEGGLSSAAMRRLLEEEERLPADHQFWLNSGADGLAVFRSERGSEILWLPFNCRELAVVGQRFHIKPLVPLLDDTQFYLLGLSQGGIRLFLGDRFRLEELPLPENTPPTMAEVLRYDEQQRQLQYHSQTSSSAGKRDAMYHGQGVGIDDQESNLERFLQAVDRGLFPALEGKGCPVVLAGPDDLQARYQRITRLKNLLHDGVRRNISGLSAKELHDYGWEIAFHHFNTSEREALERYERSRAAGDTVDDVPQVLKAASEGRVEMLLSARDRELWGVYDTFSQETMIVGRNDAPSVDLVNEAIHLTLQKQGTVQLLNDTDIPTQSQVGAILRY